MTSRMRRAGGLALSLALALASAELTLRLGALWVKATERERAGSWLTDRVRVLCLGDSNTYGLGVEPEQAWPKVFEARWNEQPRRAPMEVMNLGFPGMNSSRVLHDLPRVLRAFRPDIVLVMIGTNDYWTRPVPLPADGVAAPSLSDRLWRWSRLYRLLYIARGALADRDPDWTDVELGGFASGSATMRYGGEAFELGWEQQLPGPPGRQATAALARNLAAIADTTRAFGVRLVFVAYPSEWRFYDAANGQLRRAARATGTALVDLSARFRPLCPDGRCRELLDDHHPSVWGHALAAQTLVEAFAANGFEARAP